VVEKILVDKLIEDGAQLLACLDLEKFPVEAMFWINDPYRGEWALAIASPIVGTGGAALAYRKLDEILRRAATNAPMLSEISLLDPASQQFHELLSIAQHSPLVDVGQSWVIYRDAIVYRWSSAAVRADLDCEIEPKQLTKIWEAEHRRGNLPRLLFSTDGRHVTIRFHPQHPRVGGIGNVKRAFQIALHRPGAFPGCKIAWID